MEVYKTRKHCLVSFFHFCLIYDPAEPIPLTWVKGTLVFGAINNIGYGRTRRFTSTLQATFQLSQFRQGTRARGIRVCTTHAILDAKILNMQKGTRLDWYQIKLGCMKTPDRCANKYYVILGFGGICWFF